MNKSLPIVSSFLIDGDYIFNKNTIKQNIKYGKKLSVKSLLKRKKTYQTVKVLFGEWTEKILFFFNDVVVSCYPESRLKWLQNMQLYIDECNYPKCNYEEINVDQRYTICSLSKGDVSYKPYNIIHFCKDLLTYNIETAHITHHKYSDSVIKELKKYNICEIVSYVQHGDVSACNVLWNKSQYELIDFDLIDIYPALYDFFTFLTFESVGIFGLPYFINGYFDVELSRLFNLPVSNIEQIKDIYLAIFLIFRKSRLKSNYRLLSRILPHSYHTSLKVINDYKKGL